MDILRLRGGVVAAALTPFRDDGSIDHDAVGPYACALRDRGVSGLAVGAHSGRGAHLDLATLERLTGEFAACGLPVIAGVSPGLRNPGHAGDPGHAGAGGHLGHPGHLGHLGHLGHSGDPGAGGHSGAGGAVAAAVRTGERLVAAGASALLVSPMPGATRWETVALHRRLGSELGVPLVAFVLYERASGCRYDPETVTELLTLPEVIGVKVALLDDAVACQDLIVAARDADPATLLFSGEDRMYGPSLMWGADSALLGIAAALPSWSVAVMDAWARGDATDFLARSAELDALARLTFRAPVEGYIQRMAWIAAWEGILPPGASADPYGPALGAAARDDLLRAVESLTE